MKVNWTKGLSEGDKAEIKTAFLSNARLRERLMHLIREKMDAERKTALSKEGYETSNWAYRQADSIGFQRACEEIISLLS